VKSQASNGKRRQRKGEGRSISPSSSSAAPVGFWRVFGLALCAVLITYLPSLSGPFLFDDKGLPFTVADAAAKPAAFWIGGVRPILMATYWLNFLAAGQNPFGYHAVNLVLQALAASLAYLCAVSVLRRSGIHESKITILAALAAGIFMLHPLQTESVAYIAGRSEVLTGVFFFAAFAVFLRVPQSEFGFGRVLAALGLCGVAVLSKENAVVLPALMVFTGIFWTSDGIGVHIRRYARLYGSLLVLGMFAGIFILRRLAGAATAGFNVEGLTWQDYFWTQCRVIPVYLRLFIAPIGQCADWAYSFSHGALDRGAIFYGLALFAVVALAFRYRRRMPLFFYGLIVFLLLLAPTSSFVPVKDALAERRMYLPIFGLGLATAAILAQLRLSSRTLKIAVFTVLIAESGMSFLRSEVYGDDILFWQDVVRKSPSNVRGYEALAGILAAQKQWAPAIRLYEKGLALSKAQGSKETPVFQGSLASTYVFNGEPAKAREILRGMKSSEQGAVTLTELGVIAAKADDGRQALDDFTGAIRLDPNYASAYAYRGMVELASDANAAAAEDFRRALKLDPGNAFALDGIRKLAGPR
jgi:protein O-mannosyl-transferase